MPKVRGPPSTFDAPRREISTARRANSPLAIWSKSSSPRCDPGSLSTSYRSPLTSSPVGRRMKTPTTGAPTRSRPGDKRGKVRKLGGRHLIEVQTQIATVAAAARFDRAPADVPTPLRLVHCGPAALRPGARRTRRRCAATPTATSSAASLHRLRARESARRGPPRRPASPWRQNRRPSVRPPVRGPRRLPPLLHRPQPPAWPLPRRVAVPDGGGPAGPARRVCPATARLARPARGCRGQRRRPGSARPA